MQFSNEEVVQAQLVSAVKSKSTPSSWLVLAAGKSAFFDAANYAGQLQEAISNRDKKSVSVESSDIIADSIDSIRKLVRLIQKFDSVQLFYSGQVSFYKSILPAVVIARFFGKGVALMYYPDETEDKIPRWHRLILRQCRNAYVSSRYFQSDLAKLKIRSEVLIPPVNIDSFPARTIAEVQPHILLNQIDATNAGTNCAMKAVAMVKQKYPRTELSVIPDKYHENFEKADVFINCSSSETIPLALLAAMASGIPSISFETYGAREVIENGVNGLLIRANDHGQLADKIIMLIEDAALVEKLSNEAAKIRAKLSIENIIRNF